MPAGHGHSGSGVGVINWDGFVREHYDQLFRYARSLCGRYGLSPQDAEDFVQEAVLDAMGADIELRYPDSAIRYVTRIVYHKCMSQLRRRRVHAITVSMLHRSGEDPAFWERFPSQLLDAGIERLLTDCEIRACMLAFKQLASHVEEEFSSADRNLQVVFLKNLMGLTYEQVAVEMGVEAVERKWGERGRELLRGWMAALCGSSDSGTTKDSTYWRAGFRAGIRYKDDTNWKML